ncbi:hypothetical protein IAT40_004141 [Kwoniella sp. CBS 6097]
MSETDSTKTSHEFRFEPNLFQSQPLEKEKYIKRLTLAPDGSKKLTEGTVKSMSPSEGSVQPVTTDTGEAASRAPSTGAASISAQYSEEAARYNEIDDFRLEEEDTQPGTTGKTESTSSGQAAPN